MHIMYTMLYYIRIICAHIYVYSILTATPPTGFHGFNDKFQSRSDPDSKQKTETATCRSHFLLCFVGFHFGPDSKQKKETVVCTSHILNGFRFCDRLWPIMTKPVLLKKSKKSGVTDFKLGHGLWPIVTVTNVTFGHSDWSDWYKSCVCFCLKSGSERLSLLTEIESLRSRGGQRLQCKDYLVFFNRLLTDHINIGVPKYLSFTSCMPYMYDICIDLYSE